MKNTFKHIVAMLLVIVSTFSFFSVAFAQDGIQPNQTAYSGERSLRMRETASDGGNLIYYFEHGERLTVTGSKGIWYSVKTRSGKTGYSKKACITTSTYVPNPADLVFGAYDYQQTNLYIGKFTGVQIALNKWKPSLKLAQDGICGKKSVAAVKSFQESKGLKVDGKAGLKTLTALYPWR